MFFTNSGAEALECAIKTARRYHYRQAAIPSAIRIITFEGAFHGRTLATIAAGGQQKYLEGFGPKVDGLRPGRRSTTSTPPKGDHARRPPAILVEPVQGEGGIRQLPDAIAEAAARSSATSTACC